MSEGKAIRELRRVFYKAMDPLYALVEAVPQFLYDRQFYRHVRVTEGRHTPTNGKLALHILFQPAGLLPSTFLTVSHLAKKDYSVVAVSNAPLSQKDREDLLSSVALLVERPNYGHDFGGYRDGLRVVQDRGITPSRLLLLNDSIWFPLSSNETLLSELEHGTEGLTGPMFERKAGRRHAGHFESYMMMVGHRGLASPAFSDFWRGYQVSSTRRKVLARGEKGFSRALLDAGVPSKVFGSRHAFAEAIEGASTKFLQEAITYAEHDNPQHEQRRKSLVGLISAQAPNQKLIRDHILDVARTASLQEAFPLASMRIFNLPLLKKRQIASSVAMRRAYLKAVDDGFLDEPDQQILREIRSLTPRP
ncbi:rhamnan synthesis F family protein [Tabrizicola sp. BL-A-41-H6]|uniref:rhamnan synthesis F family protein n=1 Tax=Tabrizicola sp. BL-A-41-H6 TaxID=3421107 RepID=UPI003D67661E